MNRECGRRGSVIIPVQDRRIAADINELLVAGGPNPVIDTIDALAEVAGRRLSGPAVTPVMLAAIAAATEGDSVPANLALAENNASVAAAIAVAVAAD